ncbi:MAG: DNA-directed RNA polymerase subunit K [Candidatus Diapherotrites archaeon]|nr:DNA-directed RNA polymerase subunit K [Candidatus Diapherotrites archaeon]
MGITRFERARLISARALQLSLGAPPLIKAEASATPYSVAKSELLGKVLPLTVLRRYPNGNIERVPF